MNLQKPIGIVLPSSNLQKEYFNLFDFVKNKTGILFQQQSLAGVLKAKSDI